MIRASELPAVTTPNLDGLLVALILAPGAYSRNKYFSLFQDEEAHRVRRRAQLIRSLVKELSEPWSLPSAAPSSRTQAPPAAVVRETVLPSGLELVYRVEEFDYTRTARLTALEAAALRYALHRAGKGPLNLEDRERVERALASLDPTSL